MTTLTYQHRNGHREIIEFPWEDAVRRNLEAFADAIEAGTEYPFTDAQKMGNIAVLEAICQSAIKNIPVRVENIEIRPRPIAVSA